VIGCHLKKISCKIFLSCVVGGGWVARTLVDLWWVGMIGWVVLFWYDELSCLCLLRDSRQSQFVVDDNMVVGWLLKTRLWN
jgi:hypothetical protein